MSEKPPPKIATDFRIIPLDQIRPNTWNPFEESAASFDALCASIEARGFVDPLAVVETTEEVPFMILGGEHRWKAAKKLKLVEVPCMVLGEGFEEEDLQKFMTFRLNIHGRINPAKFATLYADLRLKYSEDQLKNLMAFTDKNAWKSLTKQLAGDVKSALGDGAKGAKGATIDRALQSAKPGSDLGKIVSHLMKNHGASLVYGFMVFSFGGQENVYIQMTPETREALNDLLRLTEERRTNINLLFGPMLRSFVDDLEQEVVATSEEGLHSSAEGDGEDDA